MKTIIVLCLLLSTVSLFGQSEANWIKNVVKKVITFVKDRCHFASLNGVSFGCDFQFGRNRRSVVSDDETDLSKIDEATGFDCTPVTFQDGVIPRRMFDEAFEQLDGDQNDGMNNKEIAQFKATMQILGNCLRKQNQE